MTLVAQSTRCFETFVQFVFVFFFVVFCLFCFFFNDTATTEIYTLSLHDALPISVVERGEAGCVTANVPVFLLSFHVIYISLVEAFQPREI